MRRNILHYIIDSDEINFSKLSTNLPSLESKNIFHFAGTLQKKFLDKNQYTTVEKHILVNETAFLSVIKKHQGNMKNASHNCEHVRRKHKSFITGPILSSNKNSLLKSQYALF